MATPSPPNCSRVTRLSSGGNEPFWVAPNSIKFKISPHCDLKPVHGGNWDKERRHPLTNAVKHNAIADRYRDGRPWEETSLFRNVYARRLKDGGNVRGCSSMRELVDQYYTRVDGMFEDMKRRGFHPNAGPLPVMLIGRGGEVFIGNQGNHRLAMAQVLGLRQIAGRIICRHKLSM